MTLSRNLIHFTVFEYLAQERTFVTWNSAARAVQKCKS